MQRKCSAFLNYWLSGRRYGAAQQTVAGFMPHALILCQFITDIWITFGDVVVDDLSVTAALCCLSMW